MHPFFWDAGLSHAIMEWPPPRRTLTCLLRCSPASTSSSCFWTPWIVTRRGARMALLPQQSMEDQIEIAIDLPAGSVFFFSLSLTFHIFQNRAAFFQDI